MLPGLLLSADQTNSARSEHAESSGCDLDKADCRRCRTKARRLAPHALEVPSTVACVKFSKRRGHDKQLGARKQPTEYRTMIQKRVNKGTKEIKAMMAEDADFLRPLVRSVIQEFLEAEMAEAVGAEKGE